MGRVAADTATTLKIFTVQMWELSSYSEAAKAAALAIEMWCLTTATQANVACG